MVEIPFKKFPYPSPKSNPLLLVTSHPSNKFNFKKFIDNFFTLSCWQMDT